MIQQHMPKGLLYLSYGTPRSREEIIPYLRSICGRQPSEQEVASLQNRYDLIGSFQGGLSPLNAMTSRQGQALVDYLNGQGDNYRLYEGYKHVEPSIETAVEAMYQDGIREGIVINAAPFFSQLGTLDYGRRATLVAESFGIKLYVIQSWWQSPEFLTCWKEALHSLTLSRDAFFIMAAHSVPARAEALGDPYVADIGCFAHDLAVEAGAFPYQQAWQSAPPRGQWMQPSVADVIDQALAQGYKDIVLVPIGFIADHLEVLYDDDMIYRKQIEEAGGRYYRPPMPNDRELLIQSMASAVVSVRG